MAEPERGHSERGALPSGGLAGRGGFSQGKFVAKLPAGQIRLGPAWEGSWALKVGLLYFLIVHGISCLCMVFLVYARFIGGIKKERD